MLSDKLFSRLGLFIIFIICLFSCGDMTDYERLHHSWVIDENFSLEEQEMVREGIRHWIIATDGMFDPINIIIGPVYAGQPFAVESVDPDDARVLEIEILKRSQGYEGYKLGGLYTSNDSIFMVDGRESVRVAMHEFGHFMDLDHVEERDLMGYAEKGDEVCVSQYDIDTVCSIYDCTGYNVKSTCKK